MTCALSNFEMGGGPTDRQTDGHTLALIERAVPSKNKLKLDGKISNLSSRNMSF